MKPNADITLTAEEQGLFDRIAFDWEPLTHQAFLQNGEIVAALVTSLLARKGIPEQRMQYFTNPDYRTGRVKGSHRDLFHRNRNSDVEMVRHASFLAYLRYFVCGPDLPAAIRSEFQERAARFGRVGPSDALELGNFARRQTREYSLPPHDACEEFYKLALDCGIWVSHAQVIRDTVKTLR
jgi:hypothetical protein